MAFTIPNYIKLYFLLLLVLPLFTYYCSWLRLFLSTTGLLFAIFNFAWLISKFYYNLTRKTYISPANKAVLITGCDSGFGHLAAKALDRYGFFVFAGCLFPNGIGAQKLYKSSSNRLRILSLDVTKNDDINAAIKEIEECELELWAIVNNADISDFGLIEWGNDIDRFRKILEVNLFGLIKVTKVCLPLIRKSKGRIVNIESITNRLIFEGGVPYAISKHGIKAFSNGLRCELSEFGVNIVSIEPSFYQTNIINKEQFIKDVELNWDSSLPQVKSFYEKDKYKKISKWLKFLQNSRKDITEVSKTIEKAVTILNPLNVYFCGGIFDLIFTWIANKLPDDLVTMFLENIFTMPSEKIRFWKKLN